MVVFWEMVRKNRGKKHTHTHRHVFLFHWFFDFYWGFSSIGSNPTVLVGSKMINLPFGGRAQMPTSESYGLRKREVLEEIPGNNFPRRTLPCFLFFFLAMLASLL